jgi:hypothetical protein
MTQKIEGYWFEEPYSHLSKPSPYPMPVPNAISQEIADEIYECIVRKEATAKKELYRGWTCSRITGENLGNAEYQTDEWIWPGDFAKHYVKNHRVKPTDDFLLYIGYL